MSEYLDTLKKVALKQQLEMAKRVQVQVARVYTQATEDYYEKFLMRMGDDKAVTALRMEYTRELATKLNSVIKEYNLAACDNTTGLINDILSSAYDESGLKDTGYKNAVKSITRAASDRAAQRILAGGIYKDGKGLSSRIWSSADASGRKIQEVIAEGMAKQLSAVDMAKTLETFMNPGTATKWDRAKIRKLLGPGYAAWNKDITYEALRVARTTITHAATLALKEAAEENPYLRAAKWHSVHAVGRTCEQCKKLDGQTFFIKSLPFDHPNGLCWNEPILDKSLEEIGDDIVDWVNGKKNPKLDAHFKRLNVDKPKPTMKAPVAPKATAKVPSEPKRGSDEWFDKHFGNMKNQLGDTVWEAAQGYIKNMPEHMQDYIRYNQHHLKFGSTTYSGGAHYSPSDREINMNFKKSMKDKRGRLTTFFHEFGHMMDGQSQNALRRSINSNNEAFKDALKKDYNDLLRKNASAKMWEMNPTVAERQAKNILGKKIQEWSDTTAGIQDVIGGLSLNEVDVKWTHRTSYWLRSDQYKEVASEAWANMTSAYTDAETLAIFKETFPTAFETFDQQVKDTVKLLASTSK